MTATSISSAGWFSSKTAHSWTLSLSLSPSIYPSLSLVLSRSFSLSLSRSLFLSLSSYLYYTLSLSDSRHLEDGAEAGGEAEVVGRLGVALARLHQVLPSQVLS